MIAVTVFKNEQVVSKFECKGHAGYADYGKDIVCSSVSILVINTINAIQELTNQEIDVQVDEAKGYIYCSLISPISKEAALLTDAMLLGLTGIQDNYGKKYLDLKFKEV